MTAEINRTDKIIDAITNWNASLSEADRKIKYQKLSENCFSFFRGTNHLFWSDMAEDSRLSLFGNPSTRTWIQGDLHAYNFGTFDNDNGDIVYDINDFDAALICDYQYDLWRMAISIALVADENGNLSDEELYEVLNVFSQTYIDTLSASLEAKKPLDFYFTKDNTSGKFNKFLTKVEKNNNRQKMLKKWVKVVDNENVFDYSNPKLAVLDEGEKEKIIAAFPSYKESLASELRYNSEYFLIKDIAKRKTAGVGSCGLPRYYILIDGETSYLTDDRILDMKFQQKPAAYYYINPAAKKEFERYFRNDGWRHAAAYCAMNPYTDDHLGWMKYSDNFYSVREISPYKDYFPSETLTKKKHYFNIVEIWANLIASNHVQSYRQFSKRSVVEMYYGRNKLFQELIAEIAFEYTIQVKKDWEGFKNNMK